MFEAGRESKLLRIVFGAIDFVVHNEKEDNAEYE